MGSRLPVDWAFSTAALVKISVFQYWGWEGRSFRRCGRDVTQYDCDERKDELVTLVTVDRGKKLRLVDS